MSRYHVMKDFQIVASTSSKEEAIEMVRMYQARETHYMLRSDYSIICGQIELVPYDESKPLVNYL